MAAARAIPDTMMQADMPEENQAFLPPETRTASGEMRRIGIELEFSGIDLESAADIVAGEFGGSREVVSAFEHRVTSSCLGDFNVELDYDYLKKFGREVDENDKESLLAHIPQELVAEIARRIVPIEIVSPPIAMDLIERFDAVIGRLRDAGARGTRQSPVYAFGLHLNPEMPSLDAETILAYLCGFLCLYEWLLKVSEVDWSRRVTPYINPFPTEYVRRAISRDYDPSLSELIDDYLASNADRNRALDMLPLFAHIDERRVRAVIDDPRIKPRPTLHYRLANCDIDRAGWGVLTAWRHWLEVERLAQDPERLAAISAAYLEHLDGFASRAFGDWPARCRKWLTIDDR